MKRKIGGPVRGFLRFSRRTSSSIALASFFWLIKCHKPLRFECLERLEGETKVFLLLLQFKKMPCSIAQRVYTKAIKATALFFKIILKGGPNLSWSKGLQGASTMEALESRSTLSHYGYQHRLGVCTAPIGIFNIHRSDLIREGKDWDQGKLINSLF